MSETCPTFLTHTIPVKYLYIPLRIAYVYIELAYVPRRIHTQVQVQGYRYVFTVLLAKVYRLRNQAGVVGPQTEKDLIPFPTARRIIRELVGVFTPTAGATRPKTVSPESMYFGLHGNGR